MTDPARVGQSGDWLRVSYWGFYLDGSLMYLGAVFYDEFGVR